jgi:hypothetical protein
VISRIAIRMMLQCEFAVGAFNFLIARAARHAEDLVVISFSVQL